ncbi:hypothetical protein O4H49_13975 [Kiloniella laminariae]|uniref:Uncharacterized protein n=1 Tax=Kiloniella laminariae TaxID=454162 RepID=A0ABT4LLS7_9PROT|nr:hypothetical protein [Kiloniella laminariae]MCZ4281895.1 hypothetical protein [Kiloniella laminariae]
MRKLNYFQVMKIRDQFVEEFFQLCEKGGDDFENRCALYMQEIQRLNLKLKAETPFRQVSNSR